MSKMHYFRNKFSGALRLQLYLTFDIGDLKLHNLAKLCFFKLIVTKLNFKKSVMYNVIVNTSPK